MMGRSQRSFGPKPNRGRTRQIDGAIRSQFEKCQNLGGLSCLDVSGKLQLYNLFGLDSTLT